ncbi:tectonic-2 isoform X1 [Micropterus salmoides]|uniref:tectonic-2 isoform X1 n=1 Tax=Micropterus salmoides TaxID=27706 RepID=UPI0018EBF876|nr:tectonic-2 isoform X1 [Micropterus salmoides]XP_045890928.1 tectonic-2 isoform X2 [Micropterus dolomieu]
MANVVDLFFSLSISRQVTRVLLLISLAHTQNIVVFQPSYLTATGPAVTALLLGNTSDISLNLRRVSPSNTTGSIGPPSCVAEVTQWVLTREQVGKTAVRVQLTLEKNLRLCRQNETDTDCCPKPLCVLEALQVSACVGGTPQASLLIQAKIHALLVPANAGSDNKTVIPNQVYQPLGSCPCDLTFRACDVRCCCDKDCSIEDLKLFVSHCLPGPFGGQVSPTPDYQCSVQSSENSPDWFPFLCVNSWPENNPYLGLFYQGDTITPKPGPSFQQPVLSAPVPVNVYIQGSPIFTLNDQYFTIPQNVLGQCVNNAPVAFLENFNVKCVTLLRSCPTASPLRTLSTALGIKVKNGQGGDVAVEVIDEVAIDLTQFISSADAVTFSGERLVCENVTVALDYEFYWKGNGITSITLTRTVGTVTLNSSMALTTRYSAVFLNGEFIAQPNSGNPGYQVGRPVIAGIVDTLDNNTGSIQRTSINLWKPVGDGLCSTAEKKPVLYGENSTSGCLLPVSRQNLTQCNLVRETVSSLQAALITATYVAKRGNPDPLTMTDWVNISFVTLNSSTTTEDTTSSCYGIPSHQHIHVWSLITGIVGGLPQRDIRALQVSYSLFPWALDCGGGDVSPCLDPRETRLFPITSSVTFTDIPINTGPPKTRFQINFTEYDCNRNDVCWPELAFPITKYYTGETYSQSLAKGLILVFFFITASILGTPWRQIRQAWNCATH